MPATEQSSAAGMYQTGVFDGTEVRSCNPSSYWTYVIPKSALRPGSVGWEGILPSEDGDLFSSLLYLNAHINSKPSIARPINDLTIFTKKNTEELMVNVNGMMMPKVLVYFEELCGEGWKVVDNFQGFRVWNFIVDDTFNPAYAIKNTIHVNQIIQARAQNVQSSNPHKRVPEKVQYLKYEELTEMRHLVYRIWSKYSSKMYTDDQLLSKDSDPTKAELMIYDPCEFLTAELAMEEWTGQVCEEQKNISNYFDFMNGVSASTFIKFPIMQKVHRILPEYFNPLCLSKSYLPNHISVCLKRVNIAEMKRSDDLDRTKDELRDLNDKLLIANDKEKIAIEKKIKESEARIKHIETSIKKIRNAKFGLTTELRSSSTPLNVAGTTLMEAYFAKTNDFLQMRITNAAKLEEIANRYTQKGADYVRVMDTYRKSAFDDFWKTFMDSANIPKIGMSARQLLGRLSDSEKFVEMNLSFNDVRLSPFGNFIAKFMKGAEKCLRVFTSFSTLILVVLATNQSFIYMLELRPNIMITGDGGIGKSWLLNGSAKLFFEGSTMVASNITRHAHDVEAEPGESDINDITIYRHEVQIEDMGIDKYGNTTLGDPHVKNKFTSQMTMTMTLKKMEDGRRSRYIIYNRASGTEIWVSNEANRHSGGPMGTRFLHIPATDKERIDIRKGDFEGQPNWAISEMMDEHFIKSWNLITLYSYIWAKLIETRVLPEIDSNTFRMIVNIVFENLSRSGIPHPGSRKLRMAEELAKSATMLYGVYMVFFSELGKKHRVDRDGNTRPFDPEIFLELAPFSVVTQEISIFILTLLEDQWVPKFKLMVAAELAFVAGGWPDGNVQYRTEADGTIHYIKVEIKSDTYSNVKDMLKSKPSIDDIKRTIEDLKREYVDSIPYKYQELSQGDRVRLIREKRRIAKLFDADLDAKQVPDGDDAKCGELYISYVSKTPSTINVEVELEVMSKKSKVLVPCGNVKKRISCVKEDSDDGKKHIFIAIEFLKKNISTTLVDAIGSLCHEKVIDQKVMTGLTYTTMVDEHEVALYQYFQTLDLSPKPKPLIISNRTYYDEIDYTMLANNSMHSGESSDKLPKKFDMMPLTQTVSDIIIDDDIDKINFIHFWKKSGLSYEDSKVAMPHIASTIMCDIRIDDPSYLYANSRILETYPESLVKQTLTRVKEDKKSETIRHMSHRFGLHISQIELLKRMEYEKLQAMSDSDIRNLPIDKKVTPVNTKEFTQFSNVTAGMLYGDSQSALGVGKDSQKAIDEFYANLNDANTYKRKSITKSTNWNLPDSFAGGIIQDTEMSDSDQEQDNNGEQEDQEDPESDKESALFRYQKNSKRQRICE
jgi:hypothetical protein